jgi:DNA-binding transcriptional LysR family regulator
VDGPLTADDNELLVEAALDGAGIAFVLEPGVRRHLADGRLVAVLADWCPPFPGYHLYYPSRRQVSPALRAFIDHMRSVADA